MIKLALISALLALLGACGGGDDDPDQSAPTVDCAAKPEACK